MNILRHYYKLYDFIITILEYCSVIRCYRWLGYWSVISDIIWHYISPMIAIISILWHYYWKVTVFTGIMPSDHLPWLNCIPRNLFNSYQPWNDALWSRWCKNRGYGRWVLPVAVIDTPFVFNRIVGPILSQHCQFSLIWNRYIIPLLTKMIFSYNAHLPPGISEVIKQEMKEVSEVELKGARSWEVKYPVDHVPVF